MIRLHDRAISLRKQHDESRRPGSCHVLPPAPAAVGRAFSVLCSRLHASAGWVGTSSIQYALPAFRGDDRSSGRQPPESLVWKQVVATDVDLARALGIPLPTARTLAQRQPRLLQRPVAFIAERCRAVCDVLGLNMEQVAIMVSRQPGVLSASPDLLRHIVTEMVAQIGSGLNPASAAALLARQPEFLEVPMPVLAEKCGQLASAGHLHYKSQGAEMLARLPPTEFYAVMQMQDIPGRAAALALALGGGSRPGVPRSHSPSHQSHQHTPHPFLEDDYYHRSSSSSSSGGGGGREEDMSGRERGSWDAGRDGERGRRGGAEEEDTGTGIGVHDPRLLPSMLCKCPSLLVVSASEIGHRAADLSAMLGGLAPRTAALLLQRCPNLLLLSHSQLHANLTGLAGLLNISPNKAAMFALQQPSLLKWDRSSAAEKLEEVAAALGGGLTREDVAAMCVLQPSLFSASAQRLAVKLQQLAIVLDLPPPPVTAWMSITALSEDAESGIEGLEPSVLTDESSFIAAAHTSATQPSSVAITVAAANPATAAYHSLPTHSDAQSSLHEPMPALTQPTAAEKRLPVLSNRATTRKRAPTIASPLSPTSLSLNSRVSPCVAPLDPHLVHTLVRSYPFLLTLAPSSIRAKLNAIMRGLHLDRSSVRALVLLSPSVLTLSPTALPSRVHALCEALGSAPLAQMKAALLIHPWLMTCGLDGLRSRCAEWVFALRVSKQVVGRLFMARPSLLRGSGETAEGIRELCGLLMERGVDGGVEGVLLRLAGDDQLWEAVMSHGVNDSLASLVLGPWPAVVGGDGTGLGTDDDRSQQAVSLGGVAGDRMHEKVNGGGRMQRTVGFIESGGSEPVSGTHDGGHMLTDGGRRQNSASGPVTGPKLAETGKGRGVADRDTESVPQSPNRSRRR